MGFEDLTEDEKAVFDVISKGDVLRLNTLLGSIQNVDILDENSMTPLQHAAYKGNKEMVQMLIDRGADVNLCQHQHNYTALHFAGLSGNVDVCSLLLLAGAKSQSVNSVNRTPSQMAAFVGNHNCVSTINNFIQKADVDYYTTARGQQTTPTLSPFIADSFHKFIMQININPIRVMLNLYKYEGLTQHLAEVTSTLTAMCTREMQKGSETNEVMSFKFHYLAYVVEQIMKLNATQPAPAAVPLEEKKEGSELPSKMQEFAKRLLRPGKEANFEVMDAFLREGVRNFPFRECTIFKQMVASLTSKDAPSALSVITAAINGQRGFIDNVPVCNSCGEDKPCKKCSKCKAVQYCDRECQRLHWPLHKKACARLSQAAQEGGGAKASSSEITADMQKLLMED